MAMRIAQELGVAKERYIDAKRDAVAHAQVLIGEICQRMSLRDLAKRIDRSPTYISQVATGKIECSDETYFALSGVARACVSN
jgi:plasmid maintenance system antidote protein VapI